MPLPLYGLRRAGAANPRGHLTDELWLVDARDHNLGRDRHLELDALRCGHRDRVRIAHVQLECLALNGGSVATPWISSRFWSPSVAPWTMFAIRLRRQAEQGASARHDRSVAQPSEWAWESRPPTTCSSAARRHPVAIFISRLTVWLQLPLRPIDRTRPVPTSTRTPFGSRLAFVRFGSSDHHT